jgi:glycine cleavage system transcriptional repressor
MKIWILISIAGRDRPGIVASLSRALYQNRAQIEDLSHAVVQGQFAMILIASLGNPEAGQLQNDLAGLAEDLDLHIHIKQISQQDLVPVQTGETEVFFLTIQGEDHPGLVYGISELLAERGINITNLKALRAFPELKFDYLQVFEVNIPKGVNLDLVREKLEKRGKEMGVKVDLHPRKIFRTIHQK